ncbi:hypothetical protein I3271_13085 [Photobacterium leiognathi]|uniref:hypothetical protein n=1 Tax=Photobacterium leiognathi TaxID=553611 RepID=UPI001EDECDE3|nr:hypothetical protein [Photobacterium leiognathi]MCG3885604.1 hypothetical protein [Photobacterium leiognathi]
MTTSIGYLLTATVAKISAVAILLGNGYLAFLLSSLCCLYPAAYCDGTRFFTLMA